MEMSGVRLQAGQAGAGREQKAQLCSLEVSEKPEIGCSRPD